MFIRKSAILHLSTNGTRRIVPAVVFRDQPAPGTPWLLEQKTGHDTWSIVRQGTTIKELAGETKAKESRSPRRDAQRWFGPLGGVS